VGTTDRRFDSALTWLRSTMLGEFLWVLFVTACILQFSRSLLGALEWPEPIDFTAFVQNARAWSAGTPYAPGRDPNPPHVILMFLPFSPLSPRLGLVIWLVVSSVSAKVTWSRIRNALALSWSRTLSITALAMFLGAPFTRDMVRDGNMTWVIWLPFTLAWIAARDRQLFRSGLIMGALATVKPFFGLWLLLFLAREHWRAVSGLAVGAAGALGIGIALTGVQAWISWLDMLGRITWYDGPSNAGLAGFVARAHGASLLLWLVGSLAILVVANSWLRASEEDVDWEWTLVTLTSILMAPLGWRYYYCLAIGPMIGWLSRSVAPTAIWAALALLVFCPTFEAPHRGPIDGGLLGSLPFWSLLSAWLAVGQGARVPSHPK
jgi:hypothetical protein